MAKLLLSGLVFGMITLSGSTFASDDSPLPIVVKAPSPPAGPVPIPYPNIGKSPEKPDSKSKENRKRVDKEFNRRGVLRIKEH